MTRMLLLTILGSFIVCAGCAKKEPVAAEQEGTTAVASNAGNVEPEAPAPSTNAESPASVPAPPTPPPIDSPAKESAPTPPPGAPKPDAKGPSPDQVKLLQELSTRRAATIEERKAKMQADLDKARAVLADNDASDAEKKRAEVTVETILFRGSAMGMEGFTEMFREATANVEKSQPDSEIAAIYAADMIRLESGLVRMTPAPDTLEKVSEFCSAYGEVSPMTASRLLYDVGNAEDRTNQPELAIKAFKMLAEKFPDQRIAESAEGHLLRLETIGKTFPFEGVLVNGESLNIESLRGKVVVIDFWATWCGPCVAELPNIRKLYEEFHDQGFEIVGVSLDNQKAKLEDFVKKEEIPWPQVFPEEDETLGWKSPLPTKWGIHSIPRMFLIDREGTLISTSLRGKSLEAKVREMMGAGPATAEAE